MKPDIIVPAKPKFEIPLDLQAAPKVIEKHKRNDNDDILNAMVHAADGIAEASTNAKTAAERILASEMKTPVQNISAARKRVAEISTAASRRLTDTRDRADAAIARLEQQTLPQLPKDTLGAVNAIQAMEVRQMLRAMKPEDRLKVVREAVEAGDAGFVSAVVNGSHFAHRHGPGRTGCGPRYAICGSALTTATRWNASDGCAPLSNTWTAYRVYSQSGRPESWPTSLALSPPLTAQRS
jgi:hypothetical protein